MNLYQASRQWADRPADERFENLESLREACVQYYRQSREVTASLDAMHVDVCGDDDIRIISPAGRKVTFSNFSFGQVCSLIGAPASYMAKLPAPLLAQNLNHGFRICEDRGTEMKMLVQALDGRGADDNILVRAVTSQKYTRIWNWEVADMIAPLTQRGWKTPPARPAHDDPRARPATAADVLSSGKFGISVREGDLIAPAGLYASDHDCFMFLVNEDRPVSGGPGGTESLWRGVFFKNSEVGSAALTVTMFLYEGVCGNHIVWNVSNVREVRIRHVGRAARASFDQAMYDIHRYMNSSPQEEEYKIRMAKHTLIAQDKAEVVDAVFQKRILSKKDAEAAYDLADLYEGIHGDPKSKWGFSAGITRLSQLTPFADKREELDRAAQKILVGAF